MREIITTKEAAELTGLRVRLWKYLAYRGVIKWHVAEDGRKGLDKQEVIDLYKNSKGLIHGEPN